MAAFAGVDFMVKLPVELLDEIYQGSLYDNLAGAGQVEIFQGTHPWDVGVYHYTTNTNDVRASLTRADFPSLPTLGLCLPFLNRKARKHTQEKFWETLSTRLLFSNTILMAKMAPAFSPYLKEVTILKRFQNGAYCDVGTFNMRGQGGSSGDLIRSIEALRYCPQLQAINIQLSIFNCQWQFAVTPTLASARQILGTQARIHIATKHCVRCSHAENAFGIPDYPFCGEACPDRWTFLGFLGAEHRLRDKEYWEWTSEAGGTEWKIERFVLNNNTRPKGESLLETLDDYRRDENQHGKEEALDRLKARGRTLQQLPCVDPQCPRTCAAVNTDLRFSRPYWCRTCGKHLTCGWAYCFTYCERLSTTSGFGHIIPPAKLTFTLPVPPQATSSVLPQTIDPAQIRRLGLNSPNGSYTLGLLRASIPAERASLNQTWEGPWPGVDILTPTPTFMPLNFIPAGMPYEFTYYMLVTPYTGFVAGWNSVVGDKYQTWDSEATEVAAGQLGYLETRRDCLLVADKDKNWALTVDNDDGNDSMLSHRDIEKWQRESMLTLPG